VIDTADVAVPLKLPLNVGAVNTPVVVLNCTLFVLSVYMIADPEDTFAIVRLNVDANDDVRVRRVAGPTKLLAVIIPVNGLQFRDAFF
jgi:hypothetical protein